MSSRKNSLKKESSFFMNNWSLSRKIFFSFLLLAIIFGSQTLLSINAVNQMSNSYNLYQKQSQIRETSISIQTHLSNQATYIAKWSSGQETQNIDVLQFKNNYTSDFEETNTIVNNLNYLIGNISKTSSANLLQIQNASTAFTNFLSSRLTYSQIVNQRIFPTPFQRITTDIKINSNYGEVISERAISDLSIWLFNRTTANSNSLNSSIILLPNISSNLKNSFYIVSQFNTNDYNNLTLLNTQLTQNVSLENSLIAQIREVAIKSPSISTLSPTDYANMTALFGELNTVKTVINDICEQFKTSAFNYENDLKTAQNAASIQISQLDADLNQILIWAKNGQNILVDNFQKTIINQIIFIFVAIILSLLAILGITILLNHIISSPVKSLSHWSEIISEGNLTLTQKSLHRSDEIGNLHKNFKNMNFTLHNIISDVQNTSSLISSTSEELASNTQEINATAEEVSAIAQSMATGSTQQAEIVTSIVEELHNTSEVVDKVVKQITRNLGIVRDLSEQTNVLALNTAIEAANSGEFGRGFTVIADNIRKMSDQSRRTAERITVDTRNILKQLEDAFAIISEKIENVAAVSEETAASAEEVAASAEEMTSTMESIAATSNMLTDQSIKSQQLISSFKVSKEDLDKAEDASKVKGFEPIQQYEKDLELSTTEAENLRKDLEEGNIKIKESKKELKKSKKEADKLRKQLEKNRKETEKIKNQLEASKEESSSLKQELEQTKSELTNLELANEEQANLEQTEESNIDNNNDIESKDEQANPEQIDESNIDNNSDIESKEEQPKE